MKGLPAIPPAFALKKARILQQLAVPDAEYADASPKGSVDAGIRHLIDEINTLEGFVTTSSCAGRVSVFVEGNKEPAVAVGPGAAEAANVDAGAVAVGDNEDLDEQGDIRAVTTVARVGGKGGGGNWLFVSHDPVTLEPGETASDRLGLGVAATEATSSEACYVNHSARLVHFKFEPMILHVLTASLEHAQLLLRCGLQAGFRESGAINLTAGAAPGEPVTPIVAIRSMGLSLESLVGVQSDGEPPQSTVPGPYLESLVRISSQRFAENTKRIDRFRAAVQQATQPARKKDGSEWEDTEARRERKRAEGLRRKAQVQRERRGAADGTEDADVQLPLNADIT